jgi:protein TonB
MNNYEKFKGRGPFRTEIAIVAVLIAIITVLFVIPRNEREKELTQKTEMIFIQSVDVPIVDLKDREVPKPKPVIPILSEEADIEIDTSLLMFIFDDPTLQDDPPPPEDPDGITPPDSFIVYDEPPKAIGGVAAIAKNIVYPKFAREVGAEGTVIVQSFISKKGEVLESVILKGKPGTGLDEAAIHAIEKTKWKPAVQRDRNVGVWIAIPVTFKLSQ